MQIEKRLHETEVRRAILACLYRYRHANDRLKRRENKRGAIAMRMSLRKRHGVPDDAFLEYVPLCEWQYMYHKGPAVDLTHPVSGRFPLRMLHRLFK